MLGTINLEYLFKTENVERDKFLSRLFGIFSEELVRIWCRDNRAPYTDIGRPTVYSEPSTRGSTLDFCLEHRESNKRYVAEMKCEMQYQNYKYLILHEASQLKHHNKKAFIDFLNTSRNPNNVLVKVTNKEVKIHGSILVWGKVTDGGRTEAIKQYGFADILSLESILIDLSKWNNCEYCKLIKDKTDWCNHLFEGLTLTGDK